MKNLGAETQTSEKMVEYMKRTQEAEERISVIEVKIEETDNYIKENIKNKAIATTMKNPGTKHPNMIKRQT